MSVIEHLQTLSVSEPDQPLSHERLLDFAIANNIAWCHKVAEVHGVEQGEDEYMWQAMGPMPKYFPQLVTTVAKQTKTSVKSGLSRLPEFVKDSLDCLSLSLSRAGYQRMFTSYWYGKSDSFDKLNVYRDTLGERVELVVVDSQKALSKWGERWSQNDNVQLIYPANILQSDNVRFIYVDSDSYSAGVTVFNDGKSTGIYNLFGDPGLYPLLLDKALWLFNRQPIVGYGDETELNLLKEFGFGELGPLSVWMSP